MNGNVSEWFCGGPITYLDYRPFVSVCIGVLCGRLSLNVNCSARLCPWILSFGIGYWRLTVVS
jgi:hypothetical protein